MREMKSYRDPYRDIKRTSAMSGPWTRPGRGVERVANTFMAVVIIALIAYTIIAGVIK